MSMDAFELQELSRLQRIEREYIALRAATERVEYAHAMFNSDLNNPWRPQGYGTTTVQQMYPATKSQKSPCPSKKSKLLLLCRSN